MGNIERNDISRPRCSAVCPHCRSLCKHLANHHSEFSRHDTFHQPEGIVGGFWAETSHRFHERNTLVYHTCSTMVADKCKFGKDGVWHDYENFGKCTLIGSTLRRPTD